MTLGATNALCISPFTAGTASASCIPAAGCDLSSPSLSLTSEYRLASQEAALETIACSSTERIGMEGLFGPSSSCRTEKARRGPIPEKILDRAINAWIRDGSGELPVTADDGETFVFRYRELKETAELDESVRSHFTIEILQGRDVLGFKWVDLYTSKEDPSNVTASSYTSKGCFTSICGVREATNKAIEVDYDVRRSYGNVGSSLMSLALRVARARGAKRYVSIDVEAPKFFERCGFTPTLFTDGMINMSYALIPEEEKDAGPLPPVAVYRKRAGMGMQGIREMARKR